MSLSNAQRRYLRGLTHGISPVVMVGDKGLSETVLEAIEEALDQHELIKVRLRTDRETRRSLSEEIARHCKAEPVHSIGQVSCYYRRNPERTVIELPRR
ncbi:MAG: ribosome assembly RNA-binding protein YhbY [Pseudomonadota bacterium]